jgi:hypothetical protein
VLADLDPRTPELRTGWSARHLQCVRDLVGEQPHACLGVRLQLSRREEHVLAQGKGASLDPRGEQTVGRVRVHTQVPEVDAEAWLEEAPRGRG